MLNEQNLAHNTAKFFFSSFCCFKRSVHSTLVGVSQHPYPSAVSSSSISLRFFVGVFVCLFILKESLQHTGKITQTEVPTQLKNTHQNIREPISIPYYNISSQFLFISLQHFTILSQLLVSHFPPERQQLLLLFIHFQFLISLLPAISFSN